MLILRMTSITLTEHDQLKEEDPERYWEIYYWLLMEKLEEAKQMQKLKGRQGNTGSSDVATVRERPDDFYSIIEKGEPS